MFLAIFSLKTYQIEAKLETINIEFNSISAYTPFNFFANPSFKVTLYSKSDICESHNTP